MTRLIPDATEISVPEPRRKANGDFYAQVMYKGKRYPVSAPTLEEYKAKAREIKRGIIPQAETESVKMIDLFNGYIENRRGKISPRTISNYEHCVRKPLIPVNDLAPEAVDWQKFIDDSCETYAGDSVRLYWRFIRASLNMFGYPVPKVNLPKKAKKDTILDGDQIKILLEHIRGDDAEAAIILCLHSLRVSEALAVEVEDIYDDVIHVNKTFVKDEHERYRIEKRTKTETSTREIPVFIPRLYETLPTTGRVCHYYPSRFTEKVKTLCKTAGLPECTPHDLRRSFASLAYSLRDIPERRIMEYGGWSSPEIMHEAYVRLYARTSKTDAQPLKDYFNFTTKP